MPSSANRPENGGISFRVPEEAQGWRLDKALGLLLASPSPEQEAARPGLFALADLGLRARRRLCDRSLVLVNGKPGIPGLKLRAGQEIIILPDPEGAAIPKDAPSLVYKDGGIAALYKPAGMHTAALAGSLSPSLETLLGDLLPSEEEGYASRLLNRLDAPTSGLVLASCTDGGERRWYRAVAQVDITKNKKEKNTKETKKEETQESTDQTQETDPTQSDSQTSTQSTDETKTNNENKSNSKSSSTTQINGKSSSVAHSQSSTNQSQSNSGQTSNNQSNNSSTNSSSNQQPTNEKITINIQVIGMGNTMMSGTLNVDKNSNALSVLKTLAAKNGKEVAGSDYYVSGIGGLYEKQHGPMSGWMYSVNGVAPNKAAIKYDLNDGDQVVWYYVNYN